jgi:lysophospholipase L1-like esterase
VGRTKTIIFSLIPVIVILLILEVTGRIIYPFDIDARAVTKAERDPRIELSYLSQKGKGKEILYDVHRPKEKYLPFLGWLGKPNTQLPTVKTNSLGFRDKPIEPRKPDEFRILLLGGSTAWGMGASSNEHTVAGVLESILNDGEDKVSYRVMSGAYMGWRSRQELVALMEFYDRFDPDLVVSLTGYNDLFVLMHDEDLELLTRPEVMMLAKAVDESIRPMSTLTALRKVAGSLGIWRIVVYIKEKMRRAVPKQGAVQYKPQVAKRFIPQIADRYITMANFARRHGSDLMLAIQPDIHTTKGLVTEEELGVRKRFNDRWKNIDETYGKYRIELLRQFDVRLQQEGIPVIDLGGVFDSEDEPVFLDACHLNDQGYAIMANALRDAIKSRYQPSEKR